MDSRYSGHGDAEPDTLVWISGATQGLGLGIARHVPYPKARIINVSRREHPDYETVIADLSDPGSWDLVYRDFSARLAGFRGIRALFIHNAKLSSIGFVGAVDREAYRAGVLANAAAALILGDAFLRASTGRFQAGLVLMSSDAADNAIPGNAAYCAAKAAIEQWVAVVAQEIRIRQRDAWVVAVRPGGVLTPSVEATASLDESVFPGSTRVRETLTSRVTVDEAAKRIWDALPPPEGKTIISFG